VSCGKHRHARGGRGRAEFVRAPQANMSSIRVSQYIESLDNLIHVSRLDESLILVIGDNKNAGKTRFPNGDIFPYAD
jgi:hypothetical protein